MTTVSAPKAQPSDLMGQIILAVRSMGVSPIPRNYNLFYEAYIGSNPDLTRDLAALGSRATQEDLDAISERYMGAPHAAVIEKANDRLLTELDALLKLLRQEQNSLESYGKLLSETAARINSKNSFSSEIIRSAISLLSEATDDKMAHGERTVDDMVQRSHEMDQVRRELDEYKRIANTDSLTRLSNRRAFDERLALAYDNPTALPLTALVLADIDNFKKINDSFGHPVGDKILATVASVLRANVRKDVFVARTGGEEFALLVEGNTPDEVMIICERVRRALETRTFRNTRSGINYGPVTISLGYSMAAQATDPGELYAQSDAALYYAKNSGRNRTVFFEDSMKSHYVGKSWLIYKS
ncbi:GGDEF domain-containing protein [Aliirhizobium terrae]|uniref:GGDEF domain-containing protein n=1 Tax=Terrirhizobium terrae TaxID=2926709 RepID=UPI00257589B2|nr:GGDEF domain-containing protein [Rhizobium sp. CC-CFT758]WJH40153.1 GGDEF domain-containing protein [Rhizobium sp. CC-CFT758]